MRLVTNTGIPALSRRTKLAAAGGSLLYVLVLLVSWAWTYGGLAGLFGALFSVQVGPWLIYAFGGGALLGALLAVTVVRYRLVTPTVVVAVLFAVAMYRMWQAMQGPYTLLPGTPYDIYLVAWPVVLGIAITVGFVEYTIRAWEQSESI